MNKHTWWTDKTFFSEYAPTPECVRCLLDKYAYAMFPGRMLLCEMVYILLKTLPTVSNYRTVLWLTSISRISKRHYTTREIGRKQARHIHFCPRYCTKSETHCKTLFLFIFFKYRRCRHTLLLNIIKFK